MCHIFAHRNTRPPESLIFYTSTGILVSLNLHRISINYQLWYRVSSLLGVALVTFLRVEKQCRCVRNGIPRSVHCCIDASSENATHHCRWITACNRPDRSFGPRRKASFEQYCIFCVHSCTHG
nr:hypothetical protein CFP56_01815 [Quercus suber]